MRPSHPLVEDIRRYLERPTTAAFETLVDRSFHFQMRRNEPFRRLCQATGIERVKSWKQVPAIPVSAFRTFRLQTDPSQATFRSSGTTSGQRSIHHHPYLGLYRAVIAATFSRFCWPAPEPAPPMMALIPDRAQAPDSSLSFMIDDVVKRFGAPQSVFAFGSTGVDLEQVDRWCRQCAHSQRPGLILSTSFALAQVIDEEAGCELPPGSVVFETGGFKGRTRELSRQQMLAAIESRFGISRSRVVREYGMSELTSQFYTEALAGGNPEVFVGPPWLKAQVLDPRTLTEVPDGHEGVLAIFDLANVGSALRILTEDLGRRDGGGFRLLGRARGAPIRGCSLVVEELLSDG